MKVRNTKESNYVINELLKDCIKSSDVGVNTNNAWGFGGAVKNVHQLKNGMSIHDGTAYYRHANPSRFINLRNEFGIIVAEGKKEIEQYVNTNKELF